MSSPADAPALLRFPPAGLLVRLSAVAVATPVLMRSGLPVLQRRLEPRPGARPLSLGTPDRAGPQLAAWVDAIIRRGAPVVRPGCLTRGVTLYWAMRRSGADVALCFGMGSDAGAPVGHCWLELDGRPVLEPVEDPTEKFTEVARLSSRGVTR